MMFSEVFCDPSEIQTRNRRLRRALLYSVELRGQIKEAIIRSHSEPKLKNRSISRCILSKSFEWKFQPVNPSTEDTPIPICGFRSNRLYIHSICG